MNANHQTRNTLTIAEVRDYLEPAHAARLYLSQCWWSIVPNKGGSFAETGDASAFWALVNAVESMGEPLGFTKKLNHLGQPTNQPHSDPELLLRSIIKIQPKIGKPIREIIEARCKLNGRDANQVFAERMAAYNEEMAGEEARVNHAIRIIMAQRPNPGDEPFVVGHVVDEVLNEDGEVVDYEERDISGGEWEIPIDTIIEFAEKQLEFLAKNDKVPDMIFGSEHALWTSEIARLKQIVQEMEHEGAGEGSRELDNKLLSADGMAAGMGAGK